MEKGDTIARLCGNDREKVKEALEYLKSGYTFGEKETEKMRSVFAKVTKDEVIRY